MPAIQVTDTWNSLFTTTARTVMTEVADNIYNEFVTLRMLERRGSLRKDKKGGIEVALPVKYAKNSTVKAVSGYDTIDTSPQDDLTMSRWQWKMYGGSIVISDEEMLEKTQDRITTDWNSTYDSEGLLARLNFLKDGAATFQELADRFDEVFGFKGRPVLDESAKQLIADVPFAEILNILEGLVKKSDNYLSEPSSYVNELKTLGLKGPKLFKPMRLALTGVLDGPELKLLLPLLPKDIVLKNIEQLKNNN